MKALLVGLVLGLSPLPAMAGHGHGRYDGDRCERREPSRHYGYDRHRHDSDRRDRHDRDYGHHYRRSDHDYERHCDRYEVRREEYRYRYSDRRCD